MGEEARSEVGAAVEKNRGLARSARRFVRAPQTETRLLIDTSTAAGGRYRRYSEVINQGTCDALSSEQCDYDLEGIQ